MSNAPGPYRTPSLPQLPPRARPYAAGAAALLGVFGLVYLLWPVLVPVPLEATDVPPVLVDQITTFPALEADLPVSTPLAPLLAIDGPEALAILSPSEGSMRLRRGESVTVRFNRPMVRAAEVGRLVSSSPLSFQPAVPGTARWITRSSLSFTPDARAFDRHLEAELAFAPGVTSIDGEPLVDELPRVLVFDGTPRASVEASTVPVGAPLLVHFDAPVSVPELLREMIVYERGGGARSLPVSVRSRGWVSRGEGESETRSFVIALDLRRDLEAGASIGVALAPRFSSWSTSSPHLLSYELERRPSIDGIDCQPPGEGWASCSYEGSPGEIIDIGNELIIRATHPLDGQAPTVSVVPPVPNLLASIDTTDTERAHYVTLRADWAPDQVYEVRIGSATTSTGTRLSAVPPLAVRSRGYAPQVEVATGLLSYEVDAPLVLPLRGIHVETGSVRYAAIDRATAIAAVLGTPAPPSPTTSAPTTTELPLSRLLPSARSNRWGRGALRIDALPGPALYGAIFSARRSPPEEGDVEEASTPVPPVWGSILMRTDLGISTTQIADGLAVWVTSIGWASPRSGVVVTAFDAEGSEVATGRTDGDGLVWLARPRSRIALLAAVAEGDVALLRVDERAAATGASLEIPGGAEAPTDEAVVRAIVRTDRGLYRPGETLHVIGLVRSVEGLHAAGASLPIEARLVGGGMDAASSGAAVTSSAMGMLDATLVVPRDMPLGDATIELTHEGLPIGSASVRISQYREPRFRVDVAAPTHVIAGDVAEATVGGRYLFGAPLADAEARTTVIRQTGAPHDARWHGFSFVPVGTPLHRNTLSEGVISLGVTGEIPLPIPTELAAPVRSVITVEADVTDVAGQSSAGVTRVVVHPAAIEAGVRSGAEWVRWGEPLEAEVIAVDALDAPVPDASLEVRFLREGWHGWWEWRDGDALSEGAGEGGGEGRYALRRSARREILHRCALTSGLEPVGCSFAPTRAGTYVIEVEVRDAQRRASIASRRLYVAGPDESPDRDPPGAPIELTPRRSRVLLGATAELAFECPWPEAEALIVVSRDGVLFSERRRVTAGGQVVRIPITEAMAPNAFVTLTLIRPRSGEPDASAGPASLGPPIDLHAPDLRFGAAELVVRGEIESLVVHIDDAPELAPGLEHTVEIQVHDAEGAPSAAEVVVWATDEGTLRATDFALGNLDEDLFGRSAARFALEDSRRFLRSRLDPLIEADPSGDGGGGPSGGPMALPERDLYEPTPLFVGRLVTDADGRVRVPFVPPERLTEYRLYAVATDGSTRVGSAESRRVVSRELLVRAALPRFLTEGDEAEMAAFVHNRTERALEVAVTFTVDGAADAPVVISVPAGGEAPVRRMLRAGSLSSIPVTVVATSGALSHTVSSEVAVAPNGRWVRARTLVMGVDGTRSLGLALPVGASARGALDAVVAVHPFVGLEALADELDASTWSTGWVDAALVLGLSSVMRLESASVSGIAGWRERRAHLEARLSSLLSRQNVDGGFGHYVGEASDPVVDLLALRALLAAREAGLAIEPDAIAAAIERVDDDVREGRFGGAMGAAGMNQRIVAIRVLTQVGRNTEALLEAAYATREFLDAGGLAELALAMQPSDARRSTVVALAEARAGIERGGPTRASLGTTFRPLGTLSSLIQLETALVVHARASDPTRATRRLLAPLGGEILGMLGGSDLATRAEALAALVVVAERFRGPHAPLLSLSLDGVAISPERSTDTAAHFVLPFARVASGAGGEHALLARRGVPDDDEHAPVFLALSGLWTVPVGEPEAMARGRVVALHRVYETPGGAAIGEGTELPVGALVRVRLFVHVEGDTPDEIALRDPHAAGLEPIDAGLSTSPNAALLSVLGASPEDDMADPRAYHALRSEWDIRQRAHEAHATTFYLRALSPGLHEYTYVVRATTSGTFSIPPAQIETLADSNFVARSTASHLSVAPR